MSTTPWVVSILSMAIFVHAAGGVYGQGYPNRPMRILATDVGGSFDVFARLIAPPISVAMGQPVIVENRSSAIQPGIAAKAAPDGYTALMGFNTVLTVNPSLYKLTYSVTRDLQPVTLLATAQYILVIHPSVAATNLKDFIALAKQKPGSLNYASAGVGSPLHLAAELFKKRAGIDMAHLAYKGGGPAAVAVLAGEAQVLFASVASSIPQVKAGKLKALATTGTKRSKVVPDLPTIAESGFPGFDVSTWYALLVPARTSAAIVNKIRGAAIKAVALPDVQEAMSRQGLDVETSTPQELAARMSAETGVWAGVIKDAGIKAE